MFDIPHTPVLFKNDDDDDVVGVGILEQQKPVTKC